MDKVQHKKHSFSLLEILLAIGLIGIVLGIITTQAPKFIRAEAFERGISQVKSRIALAQELMLNYQINVYAEFVPAPQEGGIRCSIQTDIPLSQQLMRTVNRHALIKGIDTVEFNDGALTSNPKLFFDGMLGSTPKGTLILKRGSCQAILTLKGFPSQILRGDYVTQENPAIYPEAVFSFI